MSIRIVSLSLAIIFLVFMSYLLLWPLGFEPPKFVAEPAPKMQGVLAPDSRLDKVSEVPTGLGPEDVAFDGKGWIYTGLSNGQIVRWKENTAKIHNWVNTQGRPLGMDFNSRGELIVADATKGLLSVDSAGRITILTKGAEDKPFRFIDDLVVGADDIIYFLDSSEHYGIENDYVLNSFMDGRPLGRLMSFNPRSKTTDIIRDKLYFPNGIALSHDAKAVLVSEMMTYRVLRIEIESSKKGESSVFANNLPGFPNNISKTERSTYRVALSAPRNPEVENLQASPLMRKMLMRLPESVIPKAKPTKYGLVIELDQGGKVVNSLHDPSGSQAFMLTSASEYNGRLYLGSIGDTGVKVLDL